MANPTQVNIGIGLDMDALKKSVGLARGEIASFVRDVKANQSDLEKFQQKTKVLDEALRIGAITTQKHTQMLQHYREKYNQLSEAEKQMAAHMKRQTELREYLVKLKANSLEMELKSKEKERLEAEAAAAKKLADQAANLARIKKNSLEMELRNKEKERLEAEAAAAKKLADQAANLARIKKNSLEMELRNKERERLEAEAAAAKKKADQLANLERIKKNSLEMELRNKEKERLEAEAAAAKKKADQLANLERIKRNSLEMELRSKEKERLEAEAAAAKKKADQLANLERIKRNSLEMELKSKEKERLEAEAAAAKKLADQAANLARIKKNSLDMELRAKEQLRNAEASREARERAADRQRLRSITDQLKTHRDIVAESDRFLERMRKQYNLSDALLNKLKQIERVRIGPNQQGVFGIKAFAASQIQTVASGMLAGAGIQAVLDKMKNFVADSAKLAIAREQIVMTMTALTNSAAAANDMVVAFKRLDQASALTFMQIGKGAQTMLGFGVSQEMLMPSLSALSEISLGNAERFQSLSLALGQVAASGKLAGQEILQMVNAGFNPLQEISRRTGRTMTDLRAATSAGEISFAMVADAIIASTEAGGRFNDMNEKYLETIGGQISKFQSDMELFKTALGESFMPLIRQFVDAMKEIMTRRGGLGKSVTQVSDTLGFAVAYFRDALSGEAFTHASKWPAMMQLLDDILERNRDAAFQLANEARGPEPVVDRAAMMARQKAETDISNLMMTTTDILAKEREELNKLIYSEEQLLATRLKLTEENTKSANESMLSLLEKDKQKTELQKRREASQRAIDAIDAALSGDPEAGLGGIKKHLSDQILQLNELGKKGGSVAEMDALAKRRKDLEQELGNVQQEINRRKKDAADEFEREFSRNRRETIRKDMEKLDAEIAKLGAEATPEQLQRAKDYKKNLEEQERKAQEAIQLSKTRQEIAGLKNLETLQERLSLLGGMIADDKITLEEEMSIRESLIKENEEEQKKRRKEFEKFGLSMSPMEEAIVKFRDIIIAEREGFISAADAMDAKLKIAEGLAKDQQVSLENPKMMDFGQAMQQAWKNTKIAMQQQKTNQILQQIDVKAGQMVNGLNELPRFGARG